MKWFAVQDVVAALVKQGFRVIDNVVAVDAVVLHHEGGETRSIVIVMKVPKLPESYLRHLLSAEDIDLNQFISSLRGVEQSAQVESKVDAKSESKPSIWDSPRVKSILEQPEGTPLDLSDLTEEESKALAREAQGMWADHPEIKDSVEWVQDLREGMYREGVKE